MVNILSNFASSFTLGLLTPLTAVCVLPLIPGFLSYLSNRLTGKGTNKKTLILIGLIVSSGVILFMFLLGLIFTTILKVSLTKVIGIISPIAFIILALISIFLIFNIEIGKFLPRIKTKSSQNPWRGAFLYGFFFGAIVVPCNPLFIAALFTKALTGMNFFINILTFIFFGIGISFPILLFSVISSAKSKAVINFLIKHKRKINLMAGMIMLAVSLYYLIVVFKIFS